MIFEVANTAYCASAVHIQVAFGNVHTIPKLSKNTTGSKVKAIIKVCFVSKYF